MREFIEQSLIEYFKTCSVDKYGQVKVMTPYSVFRDRTDEVLKYIKTDPMFSVHCYGWQYGTYYGFSPASIEQPLRAKCYEALYKYNENYHYSMTH